MFYFQVMCRLLELCLIIQLNRYGALTRSFPCKNSFVYTILYAWFLFCLGLILPFFSVPLQADEISFEEGDILYIIDRVRYQLFYLYDFMHALNIKQQFWLSFLHV